MKRMRIAFFEIEKWEEDIVKKGLSSHTLTFSSKPLSKSNAGMVPDAEAIAIFVYSKMTKDVLDKLPRLALITTMSTGFDHIDLEECKRRGIAVCHVPAYGEDTVAEHTFALILALSRRIVESVERTREGVFSCEGLCGFDLHGKTIGVVGAGNIGTHVVRMAKGFGMTVVVFDVRKDMKLARKLGFRYTTLDHLLRMSDIITLHVPYNKYTHHLLNWKNMKHIKKGAYLINTSRGGIVDTGALIKCLDSKIIAGAGLDVLEEECHVKEEKQLLSKVFKEECDLQVALQNRVLMRKKDVIVTPHNAFNSTEALLRILDTTVENIVAFSQGKKKNRV